MVAERRRVFQISISALWGLDRMCYSIKFFFFFSIVGLGIFHILVMLWESQRFLIFLSFGGDGFISPLPHL